MIITTLVTILLIWFCWCLLSYKEVDIGEEEDTDIDEPQESDF